MGKKILYDGKPVQVDSAIRDGTGLVIGDTYVRHAEYIVTVSTSQQYQKAISDLNLGGKTPRQVQVYNASGQEILTDIQITSDYVIIYPTALSSAETWTVRVTAW